MGQAAPRLLMVGQTAAKRAQTTQDRRQGILLLDAIVEAMPHYPMDDAFEAQLPGELAGYFVALARGAAAAGRTDLVSESAYEAALAIIDAIASAVASDR